MGDDMGGRQRRRRRGSVLCDDPSTALLVPSFARPHAGDGRPTRAVRYCVTRAPMSDELAKAYQAPYDSWDERIATRQLLSTH